MVAMLVLYPVNASFDRTYYLEKHMPLARASLELYGLKKVEAHLPAQAAHEEPSLYHAVTLGYFDDEATLKNAFATPAARAVLADVKNFYGGDAQLLVTQVLA
jgi:uncharacterized protein (TIGR02118 family)